MVRVHIIVDERIMCTDVPKIIQDYVKKNLVVPNKEYRDKLRMGLWLGDTPKTINLFVKQGDAYLLPYGCLRDILELCRDNNIEYKLDKNMTIRKPKATPYDVSLYDYQEVAVERMIRSHYGVLKAPAGSGKTQMGIAIACRIGGRCLWLTHTSDLLKQSYKRAVKYIPKSELGTITEGRVNIGKFITFATVQTMCNIDLEKYRDFFDVIIVDECHRVCGTPTQVTQFSKCLNSLAAFHKFGLSATVHRGDGMIKCLFALLGKVVHEVSDDDVADKIMPVGITRVDTGCQAGYLVRNSDGTLNYTKMINCLVGDKDRNNLIVDLVNSTSGATLILTDRINHIEKLQKLIHGAVAITGQMTTKKAKAEREQVIEDMKSGKARVLLATYSLAKEGLDIPCLENLILATPHNDFAVITQSIGRVARVCDGKDKATVYDLVDDFRYAVSSWNKRKSIYRKNKVYFND